MISIEELLSNNDIYYTPKGSDLVIRCLNPEHEDKSPSCRVDKNTGIFHCFSCGYKGNIYQVFGIQKDAMSLKVTSLLEKIKEIRVSAQGQEIPAGSLFFNRDYRGISGETYEKFKAFTNDLVFPDRLVFPIVDLSGRIVVFQGRHFHLNGREKYINFPRNIKLVPFPQKVDLIDGSIILVEGMFDMLNLHDKGLTNVVSVFGTKTLTKNIKILANFKFQGVRKIYIMFDGDTAGKSGSKELYETIHASKMFDVEEIILDDETDPGELSLKEVKFLKQTIYGDI